MKRWTFCLWVSTLLTGTALGELHPIVEVQTELLLGAPSKGQWLDGNLTAKGIRGGQKYRVYNLTEELEGAVGGKPEKNDPICEDVSTVTLTPKPPGGFLAIAATWNAQPRIPQVTSTTQPVYEKIAHDLLVSRGIKNPKVKLTQTLRIDLEGDGEEEVLISGTNYFTEDGSVPSDAEAGSYSFVLLRYVVKGKVQSKLIEGEFYPKRKEFNAPGSYKVGATLDCDGDGRLEIVIDGGYYEGGWVTIYRYSAGKLEKMLHVACGA